MILGDPLTFELTPQEIDDRIAACKWEADANPYQVDATLERLATALRRTEIQPPPRGVSPLT